MENVMTPEAEIAIEAAAEDCVVSMDSEGSLVLRFASIIRRHLAPMLEKLAEKNEALATFKAYVHQRLDDAGIPADPDSPHKAEGCRIGGRLDIALSFETPRAEAGPIYGGIVITTALGPSFSVERTTSGSGVMVARRHRGCCESFIVPAETVPRFIDALLAVSRAQQPVAGLDGVPVPVTAE